MSQKYRHSGYMDSEPRDERPDQRAPRDPLSMEEKIQRRSIRKATERKANEVVRCHACGRNVQESGAITAQSICLNCSAPLRCCRACSHFDSSARWQCKTEIEAAVTLKDKTNDCAAFTPRLVLDFTGRRANANANANASGSKSNDPRSQFENLFRS